MGCKSFGVNQILIGLFKIGISGLAGALKKATESGLSDREAILNLLIETLSTGNFIPEGQVEAYRIALWREYLRYN